MTDSVRSFLDAVEAFLGHLAAVDPGLLTLAALCGVANLALRARAWQGVLRAALPGSRVRYRSSFGAYVGGVGVNAIVPARAGDLVKVLLIRRSQPQAPVPTLAGSLVAETVFDMAVAGALLAWALGFGHLPGVRLPDLPAFDLALAFRYYWVSLAVLVGLAAAALLLGGRLRRFWQRVGQGLAVLRTPRRYLLTVVLWQAIGWSFRLAAAALFLAAFGVPATLQNALLVLVAGSLGGLFPATPGGLGPKQALMVVVLAGEAGRSTVLAFSAGMELTTSLVGVVLGFTCIAIMLRSLRVGAILGRARSEGVDPAGEGSFDAAPRGPGGGG